jgi:hypothetical protein
MGRDQAQDDVAGVGVAGLAQCRSEQVDIAVGVMQQPDLLVADVGDDLNREDPQQLTGPVGGFTVGARDRAQLVIVTYETVLVPAEPRSPRQGPADRSPRSAVTATLRSIRPKIRLWKGVTDHQ